MNARGERLVLGVLVLAAAGLYVSGIFEEPEVHSQEPAKEPETVLSADIVRPEVPEAPWLTAEVGTILFDRGDWRGQASVADLDNDGNLDLVAAIRRWSPEETAEGLHVWFGDGAGGFELGVEGIRRDMGYGGADTGDVDGDGFLDISFSGHDTPPQVFLNNGDRTWTEASSGLVAEGVCVDVAFGDFDGDQACDLAVLGMFPQAGGLFVFEGDARGGWELRDELLPIVDFGNSLIATDIEGDGALELVGATSQGLRIWSHDGTSFVDASQGLDPMLGSREEGSQPYISGSDLDVLAHDFDGDGVQELVLAGMIYEGHEPLRVFKRDEAGVWQRWGTGLPQDEAIFDVVLGQIDGQGAPVLVLAGRYGIKIVRVHPGGRFELLGRIENNDGPVNVASGDFDGDGADEVVFIGFGGIRTLKPSLSL